MSGAGDKPAGGWTQRVLAEGDTAPDVAGLTPAQQLQQISERFLAEAAGIAAMARVHVHAQLVAGALLALAIALVWMAEALNTAIEALCDVASPPESSIICSTQASSLPTATCVSRPARHSREIGRAHV